VNQVVAIPHLAIVPTIESYDPKRQIPVFAFVWVVIAVQILSASEVALGVATVGAPK
jgi:hypothetical protein